MSPDLFFPAVLGARQRWIAGALGVGLGFGAPFLLSVAMVASSGDPSLLILPLPFLGGLWVTQGLAPAGYSLEPGGVRLERRWLRRLLPYSAILGFDRQPRQVGGVGAIGVNALFGAHGWRWNPRTGWHYLAITNTRDLVYLHTAAGLVVISPAEPDEMVTQLRARLEGRGPDSQPPGSPAARSAGREGQS